MRLQGALRDIRDLRTGDADRALRRLDQTHDAARHGGFARARFTDDSKRLPLAQREIDVLRCDHRAALAKQAARFVGFAQTRRLQHDRLVIELAGRARNQTRDGLQQIPAVSRLRFAQKRLDGPRLFDFTQPQHGDVVGDLGHHAHVMGDEQNRRALLLAQFADQSQDLLLGGDVERRGRLVGDEQLRAQDQRHGDHDALALAARKLVRITVIQVLHIRQMHMLHHLQHALAPGPAIELGVGVEHFRDLVTDAVHGTERRHRLLEDHRHGRGTQGPHALGRGIEDVLALEQDLPARRRERLGQEPHHRERRQRFARAGFAHKAHRLAGPDAQ